MLASALLDLANYSIECGEPLPIPDSTLSDPDAELEEPRRLWETTIPGVVLVGNALRDVGVTQSVTYKIDESRMMESSESVTRRNFMPVTLESLGIDRLPISERIALANDLWESIEAETDRAAPTAAQRVELLRRIADDDANPDDTVPWEQVAAEASARWSK